MIIHSPILGHRSRAAWFLIIPALATLVCSRSPVPLPGNGPTEAPNPSRSPANAPTAAPTSTASAGNAAGPQASPGPTTNASATFSISDRYPLPHVTFVGLGLITTPGKVWVGSANGMIDVLDAKSGQVLQSIALFPGSGGLTQQRVFDLKFDGQHVWALASYKTEEKPDTLFVIDEASGTVLKQFDASAWAGDLDQKLCFSPGRIWASHQWIDTSTFEVQSNVGRWGDSCAYDGKGWMWIAGNNLSDCNPVLSVVSADDPSQHYAAWAIDLKGDSCARPITLIGDRMWVSMSVPAGNRTYTTALWAYAANGSKMTKETHQPLVMVPSPDDLPIALIGDQDGLWMLAGGKKWGYLYQLDPQTGALLDSLDLVGAEQKNTFTSNIALDDHDLWVSMVKELLRIHLR